MENEKVIIDDITLLPQEAHTKIVEITNQLEELEEKLKEYKKLEDSYAEFRTKLFDAMTNFNILKFTSLNNTQFTIVQGSPEKTEIVLEFNVDKLKVEQPDTYKKYLEQKEKITKGKANYLRITTPKGE